jgi:hypothetical protein
MCKENIDIQRAVNVMHFTKIAFSLALCGKVFSHSVSIRAVLSCAVSLVCACTVRPTLYLMTSFFQSRTLQIQPGCLQCFGLSVSIGIWAVYMSGYGFLLLSIKDIAGQAAMSDFKVLIAVQLVSICVNATITCFEMMLLYAFIEVGDSLGDCKNLVSNDSIALSSEFPEDSETLTSISGIRTQGFFMQHETTLHVKPSPPDVAGHPHEETIGLEEHRSKTPLHKGKRKTGQTELSLKKKVGHGHFDLRWIEREKHLERIDINDRQQLQTVNFDLNEGSENSSLNRSLEIHSSHEFDPSAKPFLFLPSESSDA